MNTILSIIFGCFIGWLFMWMLDNYISALKETSVETYTQQHLDPQRLDGKDEMLLAVGLVSERKSVMDSSEISLDEWIRRNEAMIGEEEAPGPAPAPAPLSSEQPITFVQTAVTMQQSSQVSAMGGPGPAPREPDSGKGAFEASAKFMASQASDEQKAQARLRLQSNMVDAQNDYKVWLKGAEDTGGARRTYVTWRQKKLADDKIDYEKNGYTNYLTENGPLDSAEKVKTYQKSKIDQQIKFEDYGLTTAALDGDWLKAAN
jgi:hypothetical protein